MIVSSAPIGGGGLTEPLTLTQTLTTAAAGITFQSGGPTLTNSGTTIAASGALAAANLSGSNTGDVTVTAPGGSSSANGATLSAQALTLTPADGTNPGLLTAGAQTVGGAKTLTGLLTTAAAGVTFTGTGTPNLSAGSSGLTSTTAVAANHFLDTAMQVRLTGVTTQTSAGAQAVLISNQMTDQANALGVDIGLGSALSATNLNTITLLSSGWGLTGGGGGTRPWRVMASGVHRFYNSASNAADVVGQTTLVGGTKAVSTTAVLTGDLIFLQRSAVGGVAGNLTYTISNGVSFTINSDNAADTSTVNWWIIRKV